MRRRAERPTSTAASRSARSRSPAIDLTSETSDRGRELDDRAGGLYDGARRLVDRAGRLAAAAGTAVVLGTRDVDAVLPAGSPVGIALTEPLTLEVPVEAGSGDDGAG